MRLVTVILEVFTEISEWFGGILGDLGSIFYTLNADEQIELTIYGILAVMGLGVGLILLIFRIVTDFFGWRR